MFIVTLILVPWMVRRLPVDYFSRHGNPSSSLRTRHPALRILLLALKNVGGVLLVLTGLVLSLPGIPGQGLLTVILGFSLLDIPGKRAFELRIVRIGPVRAALQWMRARAQEPPLEIPE